jgi:membrane protease YdiL (CAAX protease family)
MAIMKKSLVLYLAYIVGLALPALDLAPAWLAPLALAGLFLGSILLWRMDGHAFRDLGFTPPPSWPRDFGLLLSAGLLFPLLILLLPVWIGPGSIETQFGSGSSWTSVLANIVRVCLVAIVEEILFRGFYFQQLRRVSGLGAGIAGSALLWGISHIPAMVQDGVPPWQIGLGVLTFLALGMALSQIYLRKGQLLWAPIGFHVGHNLGFSLLTLLLSLDYDGPQWLLGHPTWMPESGVLGVMVWLVIWLLLRRSRSGQSLSTA